MAKSAILLSLAADLASGVVTSQSLIEECLAEIAPDGSEGRRAFIAVDAEAAIAAANEIDGRRKRGSSVPKFAGVPISIKDLFDVAGQVTRAGSRALSKRAPAVRDAEAIANLKRAGFVIVGRTNMSEFAFSGLGLNSHYGAPRNPWRRDEARIPGGSSSGAAISVADGMAHAVIGTDTGGSCRARRVQADGRARVPRRRTASLSLARCGRSDRAHRRLLRDRGRRAS